MHSASSSSTSFHPSEWTSLSYASPDTTCTSYNHKTRPHYSGHSPGRPSTTTMPPTTRAQTGSLPASFSQQPISTSSSAQPHNTNASSQPPPQPRQRNAAKHAQIFKSANDASSLETSEPNDPLELPRFTIDLSLPPEQRYAEVCAALRDEMRGLEALFDEVVGSLAPWVPLVVLRWICWALLSGVHSKEESAELRVGKPPRCRCSKTNLIT